MYNEPPSYPQPGRADIKATRLFFCQDWRLVGGKKEPTVVRLADFGDGSA
jgi:hypothetical protein